MATPCCPTEVKPAVNNYKGFGKDEKIDGLYDMYVSTTAEESSAPTKAIILVYDIFGLTPNAKQLVDQLAVGCGKDYVVCVPDFMRGQAWDPSNVPPTADGKFPEGVEPGDGVDVLFGWIMTHPNCKQDRNEEIEKIRGHLLKSYPSLSKFGMVGQCWGAKVALIAAKKPGLVDAVASCHGSFISKEDVEASTVPICMLNSKEEPETYKTEIKPVLDSNAFAAKNFFKDFPNMHHGWMATRGVGANTDFSNEEILKAYMEGLGDLTTFFTGAMA